MHTWTFFQKCQRSSVKYCYLNKLGKHYFSTININHLNSGGNPDPPFFSQNQDSQYTRDLLTWQNCQLPQTQNNYLILLWCLRGDRFVLTAELSAKLLLLLFKLPHFLPKTSKYVVFLNFKNYIFFYYDNCVSILHI